MHIAADKNQPRAGEPTSKCAGLYAGCPMLNQRKSSACAGVNHNWGCGTVQQMSVYAVISQGSVQRQSEYGDAGGEKYSWGPKRCYLRIALFIGCY